MIEPPEQGKDRDTSDDPLASQMEDDKTLVLGHLARGIAHDFKNLVTAIQGNAELALRELGPGDERIRKALMVIFSATRQSQSLIDQILAFSRDERLPNAPLDLVGIMSDTRALLEVKVPENITMDFQLPDGPIPVKANSSQMHQVMMNLCTNAFQAMLAKGGVLRVKLGKAGDHAVIEVEDSGKGIPKELREKIFDPFFTTKSIGLGNGLGLAVVQNIVLGSGGTIDVDTAAGGGGRFVIRLPLTGDPIDEPSVPATGKLDFHEKLAVLLVDDEEFMRGLGMDMLHSLGYRVSLASDGREALEMVRRKPDYFDLIMSDLRMPEMSGAELAKEVQKIRPGMPFLLITAFNNADIDDQLRESGISEVIQKPFLIEHVEKAIQRATGRA